MSGHFQVAISGDFQVSFRVANVKKVLHVSRCSLFLGGGRFGGVLAPRGPGVQRTAGREYATCEYATLVHRGMVFCECIALFALPGKA